MKRPQFITLLILIFSILANQANAQEASMQIITTQNRFGRITWLFADSAESSVIFFNAYKDTYVKNKDLYEYNITNPSEIEQMFIDEFTKLHEEFFICYSNPEEEQTHIMGFVRDDQVTEYQIYILSTGFISASVEIKFVFMQNYVNGEQALFCNIENIWQ